MPLNVVIASRGSALALAQTHLVLALCREAFPDGTFEKKIIKTTGDKIQTAPLSNQYQQLPKGLFTKEIEEALLQGEADLAVHSLKDLPTELPPGLTLGAVLPRADVRDVLIYRGQNGHPDAPPPSKGFKPHLRLSELPAGAVVATSSTRRQAQAQIARTEIRVEPIRGNVGTRLNKLASNSELDAIILARAGLDRLNFQITPEGRLEGPDVPRGLFASMIEPDEMLPCVGQGAIGIEIRENDPRLESVLAALNHQPTWECVLAERAFLRAMGGGCQTPVGAYAEIEGDQLRLRAVSFIGGISQRAEARGPLGEPEELGKHIAGQIRTQG
jgi:hydroxymethylbilane synthase